MKNYYNENDPKAAAWLKELIKQKQIPTGDVDERSIVEVRASEIKGYIQYHFFAGIGGWAYALRLAGYPESEPTITLSCPCQPFSKSGKNLAEKDERHLWPVAREIIRKLNVPITIGEQVESPSGRKWLAGVRADMESMGHRFAAADLCSPCVGSPNIRQRLYWVAHRESERRNGRSGMQRTNGRVLTQAGGAIDGVVQPNSARRNAGKSPSTPTGHWNSTEPASDTNRMGDTDSSGPQGRDERIFRCDHQWPPGTANMVVLCQDGKARRFEPGSFPLAHGVSGRVGLLRGYGNAINPWLAAEFIQAAIEAIHSDEKIIHQPELFT